MSVVIQQATINHIDAWVALRSKLWVPTKDDDFYAEVHEILSNPISSAFLAFNGSFIGFIEVSIHKNESGCNTANVGFIEGLFVEIDHRRSGIARQLVSASYNWFRDRGCKEVASDSLLENETSIAMHRALGFNEIERVVKFARLLP